jgi:hypothetical protein
MSKDKFGQGERIARVIHLLVVDGGMSYPELRKRFSKCSEATIHRDIGLLKKVGLVVEKKVLKTTENVDSRKVFIFFKDDIDIVGKTKRAMEILKKDFRQVTLDQIASISGLPPTKITEAAYALAAQLDLLIGKEAIEAPPAPFYWSSGKKSNNSPRVR